ncbi:MAG: polyphenol oxidase family protein [Polyangiaceae bacterium]|nr:polyphenol oxidase family protein [Polyangiaceae bacterium]
MNHLPSNLLSAAGFKHGFSLAPYDAKQASNQEDVKRLCADLGIRFDDLRQVEQVHGSRVVFTRDLARSFEEKADAVIATAGQAAGIRVADCVPILVASLASGNVAAIHAGWPGLVAGVIRTSLSALRKCGRSPDGEDSDAGLIAAIGPHIGPCCFEVGDDVAKKIVAAVGSASVLAPPKNMVREGDLNEIKPHIDLGLAARLELERMGVRLIEDVAGCTKCGGSAFHSYRGQGEKAGRHLAVIAARS